MFYTVFIKGAVINYMGGLTMDPADFSPLNENPPLPLYVPDGNHFNAFSSIALIIL